MEEHFFQCPYCWEQISMLLDSSIKSQTYVEDCEVCCNPIELKVIFEENTLTELNINSIE
ncbi:CPXCG motif-containing cysteine-rich protein [Lutibacter sp.]|uniref:CPXCG motif-containing cysteine-rich protein n=1 Tax=Lutibacter sp. TaxID=1925666 RepID=UPI003568C368